MRRVPRPRPPRGALPERPSAMDCSSDWLIPFTSSAILTQRGLQHRERRRARRTINRALQLWQSTTNVE